jgi:hypothetical protein
MTRRPDPPQPHPKGDPGREQRLAAALRANLRRRKTQVEKPGDVEASITDLEPNP